MLTVPPGTSSTPLPTLGVAAMGFGWEISELRRGDGELLATGARRSRRFGPATWAALIDAATSAASTVFDGPPRLRMPARIDRVHVHGARPGGGACCTCDGAADGTIDRCVDRRPVRRGAGLDRRAWRSRNWRAAAAAGRHDDTTPDAAPRGVASGAGTADARPPSRGAGRWRRRRRWRRVHAGSDRLPRVAHRVFGDPDEIACLRRTRTPVRWCSSCRPTDDAPRGARSNWCWRTLKHLHDNGSSARLWVLTTGVYEGDNLEPCAAVGDGAGGCGRTSAAVGRCARRRRRMSFPSRSSGRCTATAWSSCATASPMPRGWRMRRPAGRRADDVFARRHLSDHRWHRCARPADGTATRRPRRAPAGAAVPFGHAATAARGAPRTTSRWCAVVSGLEERGVSVHVAAVDIAAPGAADAAARRASQLPPVRGVVHAAGVEAGALLVNTTPDDIADGDAAQGRRHAHTARVVPAGAAGLDGAVLVVRLPGGLSRARAPMRARTRSSTRWLGTGAASATAPPPSRGPRGAASVWVRRRGSSRRNWTALGMGTVGADDAHACPGSGDARR